MQFWQIGQEYITLQLPHIIFEVKYVRARGESTFCAYERGVLEGKNNPRGLFSFPSLSILGGCCDIHTYFSFRGYF